RFFRTFSRRSRRLALQWECNCRKSRLKSIASRESVNRLRRSGSVSGGCNSILLPFPDPLPMSRIESGRTTTQEMIPLHLRELSTPVLTIDLDILDRNLNRMASSCREQGVGLRPHIKTHKTPEVARMQLDRGAVGLTVAKVGEAEVMAAAGFDGILIAFPIFGRDKVDRIATLARDRTILVSLDNERTAEGLSRAAIEKGATVGILVEFDAGFHRCGLQPGPACAALARRIEKLPGLRFRGLMSFFGNVWGIEAERRAESKQVAEKVYRALEALEEAR